MNHVSTQLARRLVAIMLLSLGACSSSSGILTDGRILTDSRVLVDSSVLPDSSVAREDAALNAFDAATSSADANPTTPDASTTTLDARIATVDSSASATDDATRSIDAKPTIPDATAPTPDARVATVDASTPRPDAAPPISGLIGYWKFDETTGTTAADSSDNGNNGTLTNMSFESSSTTDVASQITFSDPRSLTFNGSSDFVDVGAATAMQFAAGQDFTVSAWIKPTDTGSTQLVVFRGRASDGGYYDLGVSGGVAFWESNLAAAVSTTDPFDGNWHLVTGVRSSGVNSLYVDGVLEGQPFANNDAAGVGNYPLVLGYRDEVSDYFFAGSMDDVRFYGRALSADEIASIAAGN